jgi:hypothetical protein
MKSVVERAKEAIAAVFSDTSVSPGTTRNRLEDLRDYIDEDLSALEATAEDEEDIEVE